MKMGKHYLRRAIQANEITCLRSIHFYLNQIYYLKMFGDDKTRYITDANAKKLNTVEREWFASEESKCRRQYNLMQHVTLESVTKALQHHPVYQHALFEYFEHFADQNNMRWYFLNESVLNLEFFDYLALALVGSSEKARSEIIKNCWDEAGQGEINRFHTTLYKDFLTQLKLTYNRDLIIANMPWQGLAGINLFSYYALYPYNKMKFYGLMAATEVLDPEQYHRLLKGIKRVFGSCSTTYYQEHEVVDVIHASGWIEKVIMPELQAHPEKLNDFWMGFYMRLDSVKEYYDFFSHSLVSVKAA